MPDRIFVIEDERPPVTLTSKPLVQRGFETYFAAAKETDAGAGAL
ncbi:MAG TPA: hypothetical protein VN828_15210 [Acidobacteriaceae bacterium]|nr:hypothetical protein [Acidobacteriaceae bacterium]